MLDSQIISLNPFITVRDVTLFFLLLRKCRFLDTDEPAPILKSILEGDPGFFPAQSISSTNTLPSILTSASSSFRQVMPSIPAPVTKHTMQTRSKTGVRKPKKQFSLLSTVSFFIILSPVNV